MASEIYRIAILGCRGRGTAAARAYHAHPRCEIVGLCDLVPELLNTLGEELGVKARYDDLDKMIQETAPDIVAVPTGTEFHYPLCMRVVEHGVNIDVEKPICVDLVQADNLLQKAEEKVIQIAVHHQGRSGASLKAVAAALREGKIGQLRHITASGKGYYGGYGLMNIGTHLLNNVLELAGHCEHVSASCLTDGHPSTAEDVVPSPSGMGTILGEHITATLAFEGNVTGALLQHRFPTVDSTAYGIEVFGTEGRLFCKSHAAWRMPVPHFVPDSDESVWEPLPLEIPEHYDPESPPALDDYMYADDYVRALDEGRPHPSNGAEGRHVLEIMMGVFESAKLSKPVELPQKNRNHPLVQWRQESGLGDPPEMPRPVAEWLAAEDERLGRS